MTVVGLLLFGGCGEKEEPPRAVAVREDGALEIKAMSFNVWYENESLSGKRAWNQRVIGIVRLIREQDVDVLGIQEGLHGQVADLWASLPDYHVVGSGRDDGRRKGEYAAIFFRKERFERDGINSGMMWLSETPQTAGSKGWGADYPRVANWVRLIDRSSGRGFWVVNVHLDHRSQIARENGTRMVAEKLVEFNTAGEPVVWLGDFNAMGDNSVLRFIRGEKSTIDPVNGYRGMTETFHQLHPNEKRPGTFNFLSETPDRQWKVDHIFVSSDAEVLEAEIVRGGEPFLSDHFPVVARVRWK